MSDIMVGLEQIFFFVMMFDGRKSCSVGGIKALCEDNISPAYCSSNKYKSAIPGNHVIPSKVRGQSIPISFGILIDWP